MSCVVCGVCGAGGRCAAVSGCVCGGMSLSRPRPAAGGGPRFIKIIEHRRHVHVHKTKSFRAPRSGDVEIDRTSEVSKSPGIVSQCRVDLSTLSRSSLQVGTSNSLALALAAARSARARASLPLDATRHSTLSHARPSALPLAGHPLSLCVCASPLPLRTGQPGLDPPTGP